MSWTNCILNSPAAKRCEGVFVSNQTFEQMSDDTNNNNNQRVLELVGKIAELANHKRSIDLQYGSRQFSFHKKGFPWDTCMFI